jgi:hypothetical protein
MHLTFELGFGGFIIQTSILLNVTTFAGDGASLLIGLYHEEKRVNCHVGMNNYTTLKSFLSDVPY